MALNGSGVAVINSAGQPVVANTLITAAMMNALTADLATMISTAIMRDGQSTITGNIPFNSKKITGLAAGTARTDGASLATVQDGTGVYCATVGGTADVITLTPSPAITAYAAGQTFRFIASGANTTNVTVAISGLVAKAITKNGTTALVAGDIPSATMACITYDGTRFILGATGRDYATVTGAEALTSKTVNLTSNTLTGTTAQFNTALSDNDFATLAGAEALTNKTLTAPVINGAVTGTGTIPSTLPTTGALKAGGAATLNPYAVSSAGSVLHSLGGTPTLVSWYLECLSTELGYDVGDRVYQLSDMDAGSGARGFSTFAETTTVGYTTNGTLPQIIHKTTGASVAIVAAKWKLIVTPFKVN